MQFLTEIEFEPNNNFEQATNISDGDARSGQLHSSSDVDVYKITANKPGTINVQLDLPSEDFYGGYNNWSVNLKNTDGEILVSKEYGEFPGTPSFSAAAVTAGDYFLSIKSSTNHTDHAYSVSASTDNKLNSTELNPTIILSRQLISQMALALRTSPSICSAELPLDQRSAATP